MLNHKLETVRLEFFRNYQNVVVNLPDHVLLVGSNGSGKTNFLEAISMLDQGRGFRGAELSELNHKSYNEKFVIICDLKNGSGKNRVAVSTRIKADAEKPSKLTLLDSEVVKSSKDLNLYIRLLWLIPKMDNFFLEDNTTQRKFFDRLVSNFFPFHLSELSSYNKAVSERNRMLKMHTSNNQWLSAIEKVISAKAIIIAANRIEFVDNLNQSLATEGIKFSQIKISLKGDIEQYFFQNSALATEQFFQQSLLDSRSVDAQKGFTSSGVHKTVFQVIHLKSASLADNCSTGEQKIMLITIIMTLSYLVKLEYNVSPILLLDELFVHLDYKTRNNVLFNLLAGSNQFLITSTEEQYLDAKLASQLSILEVSNNSIQPKS